MTLVHVLCLALGCAIGLGFASFLFVAQRADLTTTAKAARERAKSLDKANGVLRRELFELRATYEPTRDHGYGRAHG